MIYWVYLKQTGLNKMLATQLRKQGFKVQYFGNNLIVSLTNRKISTLEVKTALDNHKLNILSTTQGVMIVL